MVGRIRNLSKLGGLIFFFSTSVAIEQYKNYLRSKTKFENTAYLSA